MNSIKILSKLCKLETLDAVERNILLLLYDKHLVQGEVNYLTPKELLELKLCKKSSLHNKLSNLSTSGFVDSIDGKYFITDKLLYEIGKIEWEDLTIRQIDRVVANVKDHTIEKIEEFIKNELLTTSNQRQELFDLLRKSSNMMASLKSWFISEFGLSIGITHYNNFVKYNLA